MLNIPSLLPILPIIKSNLIFIIRIDYDPTGREGRKGAGPMLKEGIRQTQRERVRQRPMGSPTQLLVCIEGTERGEPQGFLYHCRWKRLVPFCGIGELIFRAEAMDRLLRESGSLTGDGSLSGNSSLKKEQVKAWQSLPQEYREIRRPARETREEFSLRFRDIRVKELLTLYISGRQNASLQGWIRGRRTDGRPAGFRSAMELMELLSGAGAGGKVKASGKEAEGLREVSDSTGREEKKLWKIPGSTGREDTGQLKIQGNNWEGTVGIQE